MDVGVVEHVALFCLRNHGDQTGYVVARLGCEIGGEVAVLSSAVENRHFHRLDSTEGVGIVWFWQRIVVADMLKNPVIH
jgi:hypothetical protein